MKRRAHRRTTLIARPVRVGAIALLVVLTVVLLVSIFGLVAVNRGLFRLRADRERLSNLLFLAGSVGETDDAHLARFAAAYLDNTVLRPLLPFEPEAADIVERITLATEKIRAGATPIAYGEMLRRDLWSLYNWYGPYIAAHASTYARFLGFFAFGLAVALSAAVASHSAINRVEAHRRRVQELAQDRIRHFELEHRSVMMELHDSVGQQIAAAQLRISMIDDPAAEECARLLDASRETIRGLARRLYPAELDAIGLPGAVRQLCEDAVAPANVAYDLDLEEDIDDHLAPPQRIQVYRIIQEAVMNAMKHSKASNLGLSLKCAADSVWLTVRDDGVGFEHTGPRPTHGFGIMSMTERATMVDGTLAVISQPGAGTLVTLQMPARRTRSDVKSTSSAAG